LLGEVRNNGTLPGEPKITVTARDASGQVIASDTFYANDGKNMDPGGKRAIDHHVTDDRRAKRVEAAVTDVIVWPK
jgi:hypothetical protein